MKKNTLIVLPIFLTALIGRGGGHDSPVSWTVVAVAPPAAFSRVAMLRRYQGVITPAAFQLQMYLQRASEAHRAGKPALALEYLPKIKNHLRNAVALEQIGLPRLIAEIMWNQLETVSPLLPPGKFVVRIVSASRPELNVVAASFVKLHDTMLDVEAVFRILEGLEPFNAEIDAHKIWRPRHPRSDNRFIKLAVERVAQSVANGLYESLQSVPRGEWRDYKSSILKRSVDAGVMALGNLDVNAFISGGRVAILRRPWASA